MTIIWLSNENIRSIAFTINPKNIRLVSCLERPTKFKTKILFTVPVGIQELGISEDSLFFVAMKIGNCAFTTYVHEAPKVAAPISRKLKRRKE